jgi:hypothetical protein
MPQVFGQQQASTACLIPRHARVELPTGVGLQQVDPFLHHLR